MTILFVFLYLLCVVGGYMFVSESHSKGGRWSYTTPNLFDLLIVLAPTNVIATLFWILGLAKEEPRKSINLSKLFNIKK